MQLLSGSVTLLTHQLRMSLPSVCFESLVFPYSMTVPSAVTAENHCDGLSGVPLRVTRVKSSTSLPYTALVTA